MFVVRSPDERELALSLAQAGLNDCEISRRTGVPRSTVRDWRRPAAERTRCPRCWRAVHRPVLFADGDYAELLGMYLGDGCLSQTSRAMRLRLSLDARYPGIVEDSRRLLARCFPYNPVGISTADGGSTVIVSVYSNHLTCLFPQHAPGKKHERPIVLEPWQRACVEGFPWRFLRGCIRSDGCAFINRTGKYSYLTYDFCNLSSDIRGLFTHCCDLVGVEYRHRGDRVRVNRRPSVALMYAHIGVKE